MDASAIIGSRDKEEIQMKFTPDEAMLMQRCIRDRMDRLYDMIREERKESDPMEHLCKEWRQEARSICDIMNKMFNEMTDWEAK